MCPHKKPVFQPVRRRGPNRRAGFRRDGSESRERCAESRHKNANLDRCCAESLRDSSDLRQCCARSRRDTWELRHCCAESRHGNCHHPKSCARFWREAPDSPGCCAGFRRETVERPASAAVSLHFEGMRAGTATETRSKLPPLTNSHKPSLRPFSSQPGGRLFRRPPIPWGPFPVNGCQRMRKTMTRRSKRHSHSTALAGWTASVSP